MKKLLAILLATIMVLGLFAGCNNDATGTTSGSGNKKPSGGNKTEDGITLEVDYAEIGEASKKATAKVPEGGKHVQILTAETKEMAIEIGTVGQIKTSIVPTDAADKSLYYESSNEAVAKVDKDGKVLGMEAGKATISVITNDRNFKVKVEVTVYRVETDTEKVDAMIKLINDARAAENLKALEVNPDLNAAATARAFEEAAEKDKKMDDTRPIKDAKGDFKAHNTVFDDFDIFCRGKASVYVWDSYKDVQEAYDAIVKDENNKEALLAEDTKYSHVGAGCFTDGKTTYWCILIYLR